MNLHFKINLSSDTHESNAPVTQDGVKFPQITVTCLALPLVAKPFHACCANHSEPSILREVALYNIYIYTLVQNCTLMQCRVYFHFGFFKQPPIQCTSRHYRSHQVMTALLFSEIGRKHLKSPRSAFRLSQHTTLDITAVSYHLPLACSLALQ